MHGNPAVLSGLAARPGDSLGSCTGIELAFPGIALAFPFFLQKKLWKYGITRKQNKTTLALFRTLLTFSVLVVQSCLTLSDPMDCSLPGSSAHGIFQARVLEWVAIAFSKITLDNIIDMDLQALTDL